MINIKFKVLACKFHKHVVAKDLRKALMYAAPIMVMHKSNNLSVEETEWYQENMVPMLKYWKEGKVLEARYFKSESIHADADHVMSSSMWKGLQSFGTSMKYTVEFEGIGASTKTEEEWA